MSNWIIARPDCLPEKYNASSDPCDTVRGPCACGAWHHLYELTTKELEILCLRAVETEKENK